MKLGYLMIPQDSAEKMRPRDIGRAEMARGLGFSEFYSLSTSDHLLRSSNLSQSPEHAERLRTLDEVVEKPDLHVAAIDGERQPQRKLVMKTENVFPSASSQQVAANAYQSRSSLSVSWLDKCELAQHWGAHVVGSTHAGVRARPEDWRIARTVLISDDPHRAKAAVTAQDSPCRAYYSKAAGPDVDVDAVLERCVLAGNLQTVLAELDMIRATSAPFGTLTLLDHAWNDVELAENSLASLATIFAPSLSLNRALS